MTRPLSRHSERSVSEVKNLFLYPSTYSFFTITYYLFEILTASPQNDSGGHLRMARSLYCHSERSVSEVKNLRNKKLP